MTADTAVIAGAGGAIAVIVVLIVGLKLHPFLALVLGALFMGFAARLDALAIVAALKQGVGNTLGGVGLILALGAMLGKLLVVSGGADALAGRILASAGPRRVPWAMAAVAALLGLPLFFEVGLVVVIPMIFAVASRLPRDPARPGSPYLIAGLPALAGLAALHALVPPHPGPLAAVMGLSADMGKTNALGVLLAIPAVIVAGPIYAGRIAGRVVATPPSLAREGTTRAPLAEHHATPGAAMLVILLPVALIVARTFVEAALPPKSGLTGVAAFLGEPSIALLVSVLVAVPLLGLGRLGMPKVSGMLGDSLAPIASVLLIIGAGGGFKQVLIEAGVGTGIAHIALTWAVPPLVLGWVIAALVRLATGSATVATLTAAGLMTPIAASLAPDGRVLLVLAIGSGSIIFSHVNDAGFWMVKELFGMSVADTLQTWSVAVTIISFVGLGLVLGLDMFL